MTRPTDDQVRWMVRHPITTILFFVFELPFYILELMEWLLLKAETKEQRRIRIKMQRAIAYYIIRFFRYLES